MPAPRVAVLLVGLAAIGCGSGGVGKQPSWRATEAPADDTPIPEASGAPIVVEPSLPGAQYYNDPDIGDAPSSELADALVDAVGDAAEQSGHDRPVADARLFAVADDLAPVAREDSPIPYSLVEFSLRHHGIVEPTPHVILIWGPLDRHDVIAEQLRSRLPSVFAGTSVARVGVGARERGDNGVILLVLQPSSIETEPIPRQIRGDQSVTLRARVLPPYRDPEVFVTGEDGKVTQPRTAVGADGRLVATVACNGHRGAQQIEITAVDSGGSAVLANFPVWCGTDPPTSAQVTPVEVGDEPIGDVDAAERLLLALVNRDRKDAGLAPVAELPALSDVARAHSEEMRATGNVAHVSATTGSAADRVRAAGIRTALVLENVARAYGVSEAQEGLMNSPGHRANVLAREATHVGIGIAFGDTVVGNRELFVTQVFIRVPPKIDRAEAVEKLRARIAASVGLQHDDELAAIAGEFAGAVARGETTAAAAKASARRLDELSKRYLKVTTIVNPVADVDAFPVEAVAKDSSMTHFGVGVAQGPHDVIGDDAIHVVILVGRRR